MKIWFILHKKGTNAQFWDEWIRFGGRIGREFCKPILKNHFTWLGINALIDAI
jgi:hypothetical protein